MAASSLAIVNPDTASKSDLVEIVSDQQTQIEQLEQGQDLPLAADLTLAAGSAYGTARLDARMGAGGKIQAGVATASAAAAIALRSSSPVVAAGLRSVAVGTASGMAAVAGHKQGEAELAAAAAEEQKRLEQQQSGQKA